MDLGKELLILLWILLTNLSNYIQGSISNDIPVTLQKIEPILKSTSTGNFLMRLISRNNLTLVSFNLHRANHNFDAPVFRICDQGKSICKFNQPREKTPVIFYDAGRQAVLSVIEISSQNNQWAGHFLANGSAYELHTLPGSHPSLSNHYAINISPDLAYPTDYIKLNSNTLISDEHVRNPFEKLRHGRQFNTNLVVELLIVIDNVIYSEWYKKGTASSSLQRSVETVDALKRYFAHVVTGINLRYEAIVGRNYQIRVTLVGYIIAQSNYRLPSFASESSKRSIDADDSLSAFRSWVQQTTLPPNDHVMLFTGHDVYTIRQGLKMDAVTGLAYLGQICTRSSVSIVEYHGGFSSSLIATHELGHSLGAKHDGEENACQSSDQFIMTGQARPVDNKQIRTNPWKFSSCSLRAFGQMVAVLNTRPGRDCVFRTDSDFSQSSIRRYLTQPAGQWFTMDEVCRQHLGSKSYMCRDLLKNQEDICTSLWCHRPNTNKCRQHVPPRGTSCGNKKWCINGVCVYDSKAPPKGECVHGDHPGVVHGNQTCSQMVSAEPYYCYQAYILRRCCLHCLKHYRPIIGCEYGNRQKNCPKIWCERVVERRDEMLKQCCGTCNYGTRKQTSFTSSSITSYSTTLSTRTTSLTCTDRHQDCSTMVQSSPSSCYRDTFNKNCCHSCQTIRSFSQDCYYGDRDVEKCSNSTTSLCMQARWRTLCCNICTTFTSPSSSLHINIISTLLCLLSPLCSFLL